MGITKTDIFNAKQNRLANYFKVLGHPARLAILEYVAKQEGCICNDLVDELGLAQATISQHLKALKESGIIQGTIEGKSVCYCINQEVWGSIQAEIKDLFKQELSVKSCC